MQLWQATLEHIGTSAVTSEPWGRDRGRVEELLAQLYILGERPTVDELCSYLLERSPTDRDAWRDKIVALWRERLKRPAFQPASVKKATGWAHPFTVLEMLVEKHDLTPIGDRLVSALDAAARTYLQSAEADPATAAYGDAADVYMLTAQAVRTWALSRDRINDLPWPSVTKPSRARDNLIVYATHSGRAREQARIEKARERYEPEHPPRDPDDS